MKSPSKKITLALAFLAIAASASAQAQNRVVVQYETVARLIETKPLYVMKAGGSHQECTESAGQRSQERSNSGAVIGAIAGGLAGKSIGNGNTAATAAGAAIGDRIQNDGNANGYSVQKQCYLVQDPPVEVQSGFTSILEVNDEGGNHRVTVQTQSPLRSDANGLVRIRVGIAINQY